MRPLITLEAKAANLFSQGYTIDAVKNKLELKWGWAQRYYASWKAAEPTSNAVMDFLTETREIEKELFDMIFEQNKLRDHGLPYKHLNMSIESLSNDYIKRHL